MRYHPRLDANHHEIVDTLRSAGASVQSLASVGGGCLDILVGWRGANYLMEIKDGNKPPSARKLTEKEALWWNTWKGQKAIVENGQEALRVIGLAV